MRNLPVPPNSDSVKTNCSRCFVWIALLKVESGIQLVTQSEHNEIKCLHSPVTIKSAKETFSEDVRLNNVLQVCYLIYP